MNMRRVGFARTAIGLVVIAICVYLLLNDTASAATHAENLVQLLF